MRHVYAVMAIVGAAVPIFFFIPFFQEFGVDLPAFCRLLFANSPASGFSADLLISSFVFWFWSFRDSKRLGLRHWWLVPLTNLSVGLSLALPLYFWLRYDVAKQHL